MDRDLRIPVTSEQKALIQKATDDEPEGMAAWARAILLDAARKQVERRGLSSRQAAESVSDTTEDAVSPDSA
jgi:hypothetical protein